MMADSISHRLLSGVPLRRSNQFFVLILTKKGLQEFYTLRFLPTNNNNLCLGPESVIILLFTISARLNSILIQSY